MELVRPAPTNNLAFEFLKYLVAGGVAFCADVSLLYLLTETLGFYFLVSATISFICGSAINYLICISFVFKGRNTSQQHQQKFAVFFMIGVVGLVLNNGLIWLGVNELGIHYVAAKCVSTVIGLGFNFLLRRTVVFTSSL